MNATLDQALDRYLETLDVGRTRHQGPQLRFLTRRQLHPPNQQH
jgi:hypothetical protein